VESERCPRSCVAPACLSGKILFFFRSMWFIDQTMPSVDGTPAHAVTLTRHEKRCQSCQLPPAMSNGKRCGARFPDPLEYHLVRREKTFCAEFFETRNRHHTKPGRALPRDIHTRKAGAVCLSESKPKWTVRPNPCDYLLLRPPILSISRPEKRAC